jgi:large subunit ribosomal protein L3
MGRKHKPRSGSLQFWPRKRARRIYPRIRNFSKNNQQINSFAGYKVGCTHVLMIDDQEHSITKGDRISCPVTIITCPPLKTLSLRFYQKNPTSSQLLTEIHAKNFDKELKRKINLPKKLNEKAPEKYDEIRLLVYTQPKLTNLKKKPEIFEIPFNGTLEEAKAYLEKPIKLEDVFKTGQFIDVHSVSKGKGLQGPIKRFGISLKQHKSEKKKRSAGNLGAWTPKRVSHTVPQAGQMGYQTRTEYNKLIVGIKPAEEVNRKSGFKRFGIIKNESILVKGSVPGATKRLIRFVHAIRNKHSVEPPEIEYISKR